MPHHEVTQSTRVANSFKGANSDTARKRMWSRIGDALGSSDEQIQNSVLEKLMEMLREEPHEEIRSLGLVCLLEQWFRRNMHNDSKKGSSRIFAHWLFASRSQSSRKLKGVLVAINNGRNLDDGTALVLLSRLFDTEHFSTMDLVTVPPPAQSGDESRWERSEQQTLQDADVVCFVGRPSMFADCPTVDLDNLPLRYHFPGTLSYRGKGIDQASIEAYHHLIVGKAKSERKLPVKLEQGHREEHAVVQRLFVKGNKTIVFVTGTTSLGTVAAANWLAEVGIANRSEGALTRLMDKPVGKQKIEVLLHANAAIPLGEHPWKVPSVEEKSFVVNDGANLFSSKINRVSAVVDQTGPKGIVGFHIDEEFVEFNGSKAHQQLLALCWHFSHQEHSSASLPEIVKDKAAWPFELNRPPTEGLRHQQPLIKLFQNNLQARYPTLPIHFHFPQNGQLPEQATVEAECEFTIE